MFRRGNSDYGCTRAVGYCRGHGVERESFRSIELVGNSRDSFLDAVREVIQVAAQAGRVMSHLDIISSTGKVDDRGRLVNFTVRCRVFFSVESSGERNRFQPL